MRGIPGLRLALAAAAISGFGGMQAVADTATAPQIPGGVYTESIKAIFVLFVLALVLESALAVVFNWRPFIETFNPRAVRPLIAFIVSLIFVSTFGLDITTSLVNAATLQTYPPGAAGYLVTALIVAGGSAGINSMLVAFGYRELKTPETAPKPPPTKAWIALRAKRVGAKVGDIEVFLGKAPAAGDAAALPPRVGTLTGPSRGGPLAYFLVNHDRFPKYGGFEVEPGGPYIAALRATGSSTVVKWGPQEIAAGAIVDIALEI